MIFIVDGRQGLTPHDKTITDFLRKSGRSVMLVVNKSEGMRYTAVAADFYELGLGDPYVISAAHGDGVADLVEESLNIALDKYAGTLIFVSHDREFVSSLATRIIEIKEDGITDFPGNYEDYLATQGIE